MEQKRPFLIQSSAGYEMLFAKRLLHMGVVKSPLCNLGCSRAALSCGGFNEAGEHGDAGRVGSGGSGAADGGAMSGSGNGAASRGSRIISYIRGSSLHPWATLL